MFFPSFGTSRPRRAEVHNNLEQFATKRVEKKVHVEKTAKVEEEHEMSVLDMQKARSSRFEAKKKEQGSEGNDVVKLVKKTTRKKFGLELVEDVIPEDLLCEECTTSYSTVYCSGCRQVLCPYCADICHPRVDVNTIHPHEVQKLIRPIRAGDCSSVVHEKPYPIPQFFIEEADYENATGRVLSEPNSLAVNKAENNPQPNITPYSAAKFFVDEKLVFMDPVTKQQAYGRVLCEWDFRHGGPAAPSIKRGEGSGVWYVIEKQGLVSSLGGLDELIRMTLAKPPPPSLPDFEDVESIPYREEFALAREVNAMLEATREVVEWGPRRHMRPEIVHVGHHLSRSKRGKGGGEDEEEEGEGEEEGEDGSTFISQPTVGAPLPPSSHSTLSNLKKPDKGDLVVVPISPRAAAARHFYDSLQPDLETGPGAASMDVQRLRRAPPNSESEAARREQQRLNRQLNVQLVAEKDLLRPEELIQDKDAAMDTSVRDRFLRRVIRRTTKRLLRRGFGMWREQLGHLLQVKLYLMARAIQKTARRWLCRFCLEAKQIEWEQELRRRWEAVHGRFRYSHKVHSSSKTYDKRKFFETTTDANRYAEFLRVTCAKIWALLDRKRMTLVRGAVTKWKQGSLQLTEGQIEYGHFDNETADKDEGDRDLKSPCQVRAEASALFAKFKSVGARRAGVGTDDEEYLNVSTLPLALERGSVVSVPRPNSLSAAATYGAASASSSSASGIPARASAASSSGGGGGSPGSRGSAHRRNEPTEMLCFEVPPYHPSIGVKLPPALPVYLPSDFNKRLHATQESRLRHGAYKAHMEGPSDESCWAIPGRVMMGSLPKGLASKKSSMSAITTILLTGVSTFVSLMEEEEEADLCRRFGINAVEQEMRKAATGAKFAVDEVVKECYRIVQTYTDRLNLMPSYGKSDPQYEDAQRDRARCQGRIKLAKNKAAQARAQIDKFPKSYAWLRFPFKANEAPSLNDMLPILWDLEARLAAGGNLFLYSGDGHGRVGMVAGCLVGRLYGFKPTETLTRIQQSHDCMKGQERVPVPIACPQVPAQRALVTAVCLHTNKPFLGVTWRSQGNPEECCGETHAPKPGFGKGAPLTHTTGMPHRGEEPLMAEVVEAKQERVKPSLLHEIIVERDTPKPPPSQAGRSSLPAPDLVLLFSQYKQQQDVVRELPLLNHGNGLGNPTARPSIPLLRAKLVAEGRAVRAKKANNSSKP